MALNPLERAGMERVLKYLRQRANGLQEVADRCEPNSEMGKVARIQALGLSSAAYQIEQGIQRGEKETGT